MENMSCILKLKFRVKGDAQFLSSCNRILSNNGKHFTLTVTACLFSFQILTKERMCVEEKHNAELYYYTARVLNYAVFKH